MLYKVCSTCGKNLPIADFYVQKGHKNNVMSMCKSCFNSYCSKRWKQRKIKYIKYLGGKCSNCGIQLTDENYSIFDFHHIDPSTKEFVWTKLRLLNESKILQELDKCVLLCANCHRLVHQEN